LSSISFSFNLIATTVTFLTVHDSELKRFIFLTERWSQEFSDIGCIFVSFQFCWLFSCCSLC